MKRLSALQSRSPRPYDSDLEPIEKSAGLRQIWASLRLLRDADRLPYGRAIKRVCLGPLEQVYRPRSFAGPRQSRGSSGKGFRRWLILTSMLGRYRQRSILALVLMVA